MDDWAAMATQNLADAKLLLDHGRIRSCLSRAYYAAYACITSVLIDRTTVGTGDRPNPSHNQLATMAKHNLNPARFNEASRQRIAQRVRRLLSLRIVADYDPVASLDRADALGAVRDASWIIAAVQGGEP